MDTKAYLKDNADFHKQLSTLTATWFLHHLDDHVLIDGIDMTRANDGEYVRALQVKHADEWARVSRVINLMQDHLWAFLEDLHNAFDPADEAATHCAGMYPQFLPMFMGAWISVHLIHTKNLKERMEAIRAGDLKAVPDVINIMDVWRSKTSEAFFKAFTAGVLTEIDETMDDVAQNMFGTKEPSVDDILKAIFGSKSVNL